MQLGLQRAVDAAARRKGLDQAERQGSDVKREIAGRRIDRAGGVEDDAVDGVGDGGGDGRVGHVAGHPIGVPLDRVPHA